MGTLDKYKELLMNADSLDIVYLSAETTDLYPKEGAELVSLTGVNSDGIVVLDLWFDTLYDYSSRECCSSEEEYSTCLGPYLGYPLATDVLDELRHFLTNDNGKERYCWSGWFISFFHQLLGEKPAVTSVKELACGTDLAYEIDFDECSTLSTVAFVLNIDIRSLYKEKIGVLVTQKLLKLLPISKEMAELKNRLWELEKEVKIIMGPPIPPGPVYNNDDGDDIPF